MSYDVSFRRPTVEPHQDCRAHHVDPATAPDLAWHNHTSNTAGVWRAVGLDLTLFDRRPAGALIAPLDDAITRIAADPCAFDRHVRGGGSWGTVESTLGFLRALRASAEEYPASTVEVSS
ncbi:hypothetical protein [Xylanimonas protaetiae]|uniref:Uncharacterized protein n=1 Tax=Xylanimonas protaetiae TaxID=2509457 RepID=A0A4P6F3D6_9MICO|nr:hypothetical protein [Xylanimonas protaetiae]QAY70044.1 hypothetical protein ET471_08350 [Xylanimonas protaetiae]